MGKPHILVVEDDHSLAEILKYNLSEVGYDVSVARDGKDGLRQAEVKVPDLILLDLMLPEMDGLTVCRRLRANAVTRNIVIVMVTAKVEESDEVVGFSVGADDYIGKPFSVRILLERVRSLLARSNATRLDQHVVTSQGITIDRRRHIAVAGGDTLELTPSEFDLLDTLARQPGRAFTRAELIKAALGEDAVVLERTIDVHIRALRAKLGSLGDVIQTVRGVGYRFRDVAP